MSTTRKLRLGPLPDTQTIKLAFYVFGEPQSGPRSLCCGQRYVFAMPALISAPRLSVQM